MQNTTPPQQPIVNIDATHDLWMMKYRPKTIDEVILPERIKSIVRPLCNVSNPLQHLILYGPPGCGKTTSALVIAAERGANVLFVSASREGNMDTLRNKIFDFAVTRSLSFGEPTQKIVVLDEVDASSAAMQDALRNVLEELSNVCTFIMTCNYINRVRDPILSRCYSINFSITPDEKVVLHGLMCRRSFTILNLEKVLVDKGVLAKVVWKYGSDFRSLMNFLQSVSKKETGLDVGCMANLAVESNIDIVYKIIRTHDFKALTAWVKENSTSDLSSIYRKMYDQYENYLEPSCIPELVLITYDYMKNLPNVADQEISAIAFLTQIMSSARFKD